MKKTNWIKPELIIIKRHKSEVAVLGDCKLQDGPGPVVWCMQTGSGGGGGGPACKGAAKS